MIILQVAEAASFFDAMMQQGIAFGLMALIIFVLGRRVQKLEQKLEDNAADEKAESKEIILIIKGATDVMTQVAKKL